MKKLMAILTIVFLVGGCAIIQGWLGKTVCSPTADQVASYAQQISDASASLIYFQSLVPTVPIAAIVAGLQMAIKVLSDARDGICQDQTQIAAAQDQIKSTQMLTIQMKLGKKLQMVK